MEMPRHLLWTALWTSLWCLGHSLLITRRVGRRGRALFPRYHVLGRLLYVLSASFSLAVLFAWLRTLPEHLLWSWDGWWAAVRWLGLAEAGLLFWLGARAYDGRTFLGLNQLRDFAAGRPPSSPSFRTSGILGVIRHPWYTGTLVGLVFCLPVTDVNLVWRTVFAVYVLIGTELEERKLLHQFGDEYAAYRRRVPRFVPLPRGWRRS